MRASAARYQAGVGFRLSSTRNQRLDRYAQSAEARLPEPPGGDRFARAAALALLRGEGELTEAAAVGLHQLLLDPQVVHQVIAAHRRGAKLPTPGQLLARVAVDRAGRGAGEPIPSPLRARLERALGADLSSVRLHDGAASAAAAKALHARAFTVGQSVHFGAGRYQPSSPRGQALIAHEVAHAVQQRGAAAPGALDPFDVSAPSDAHEQEADQFAKAFAAGESASLQELPRQIIQREEAAGGKPAADGKGGDKDKDKPPEEIEPEPQVLEALHQVNPHVMKAIAATSPADFIKGMRDQFNDGKPPIKEQIPAVDQAIVDWYTRLDHVKEWPWEPILHPLAGNRLRNVARMLGERSLMPRSPGFYQNPTHARAETKGKDAGKFKGKGCSLHGLGLAMDFNAYINPMIKNAELQALIRTIGGGPQNMQLPPGANKTIAIMGQGKDEKAAQSNEGELETPEQRKQHAKEQELLEKMESEMERMMAQSDRIGQVLTKNDPQALVKLKTIKKEWEAAVAAKEKAEKALKVANRKKKKDEQEKLDPKYDQAIEEQKQKLRDVLKPWHDIIDAKKKELEAAAGEPVKDAARLVAEAKRFRPGKGEQAEEKRADLNRRLNEALEKLDGDGTRELRGEENAERKKGEKLKELLDRRASAEKELATLKRLGEALSDFKFVFRRASTDPGAAQLAETGYFNSDRKFTVAFFHAMANHGFYPGACYGGGFLDSMHFRLADDLLPPPGKHATAK